MSLIVQKYGGSSVQTPERIRLVAQRVVRAHRQGHQLVIVVSAMGDTTDELVELMRQVNPKPPKREMDVLLSSGEIVSVALVASAIDAAGGKALSLVGRQIGIMTDQDHTKARIQKVECAHIKAHLNQGFIVVIAGFQGISTENNITTLGRGGSDTTAVALAAALRADTCEILSDVEGVFTADPRIVPEARKLSRISYEEMLELASLGAKVLHLRAVEMAHKYAVPLHVRSSFTNREGTIIV